ncbi:MAG TPA: M1 family aminopeptidase [Bryobacteraceae bacterium]|nr:M1 family aminopeptidase [Bryobacteraceae bacterium]
MSMLRSLLTAAGALSVLILPAAAQDRNRARLDAEHYVITAEINPAAQTLAATAEVRFVPQDATSSATFELNNALNVSRIADGSGRQIPASRSQTDHTVRLNFTDPLPKGQPTSLTFQYDGKLSGQEDSPVWGVKFASIQSDHAFLMYPARWFPITEYTVDRFTAELRISVPQGYQVVAPGLNEAPTSAGGRTVYRFVSKSASFPGSIAVVQGEPARVPSQGVTTQVYFREAKEQATAYGEETGKVMTFLTGLYGLPPQASLTLVETEAGAPNGYAAPGIIFLSPKALVKQVNPRLLANQVARQWWGTLVSPATRNHMWIVNGAARYSELLYIEANNGAGALESEVRDTFVEALTQDTVPVSQSGRLEDYSPEFWAATAGKGAAVMHMLRFNIGDEKFREGMKRFLSAHAWKQVTTSDLSRVMTEVSNQALDPFFLQWIESSGAPEFRLEYTVFRTQKGFRIMGKISQDLDTFRMPVELKIETEGNPEEKRVEVSGTSSEFILDTFGKPKRVTVDPNNRVLRFSREMRVAVAIRRGEMFAEIGEYTEALKEYQKALDVSRASSLAHYRVAEVFMLQNNYQSAANEFREALTGDLEPKWTEVWARINLGKIFDITGQRERAVNEYTLAMRTKDNAQGALEEASKYLKQPYERPRANF